MLAIVAQLVVLAAPAAEAHEEPGLAAHVEALGGRQHPGHHAEHCPACILLSVYGRVVERTQLPPIERAERVRMPTAAQCATHGADAPSNACRAPPSPV
jgi:hypothetical protein